jgi:hypothetical protein
VPRARWHLQRLDHRQVRKCVDNARRTVGPPQLDADLHRRGTAQLDVWRDDDPATRNLEHIFDDEKSHGQRGLSAALPVVGAAFVFGGVAFAGGAFVVAVPVDDAVFGFGGVVALVVPVVGAVFVVGDVAALPVVGAVFVFVVGAALPVVGAVFAFGGGVVLVGGAMFAEPRFAEPVGDGAFAEPTAGDGGATAVARSVAVLGDGAAPLPCAAAFFAFERSIAALISSSVMPGRSCSYCSMFWSGGGSTVPGITAVLLPLPCG